MRSVTPLVLTIMGCATARPAGSKERLYQLWLNDKLQVFSWLGYRKGHGPTNQGHWLRAEVS